MNKFLKIFIGFIISILTISYFLSGYIFFNFIFFTKSIEEQKQYELNSEKINGFITNLLTSKEEDIENFIKSYNRNKDITDEYIIEEKAILYSFLRSFIDIQELNLKSYDNLNLKAYLIKNNYFNNENDNFIIIAHPYRSSHYQCIINAYEFYKLGLNVILLDLRGHGDSEGNYTTLGFKEGKDIRDWINNISFLYPNSKIITYGVSLGASSVLSACGEKLTKNFKLCIADCPFDSLDNTIYNTGRLLIGIPSILTSIIISGVNIFSNIIVGSSVYHNISDTLYRSKVPILFIHSDKDAFIPSYNSYHMYNNYKGEKKLLIIKNAGHIEGLYKDRNLYLKTIKDMISKYIP